MGAHLLSATNVPAKTDGSNVIDLMAAKKSLGTEGVTEEGSVTLVDASEIKAC